MHNPASRDGYVRRKPVPQPGSQEIQPAHGRSGSHAQDRAVTSSASSGRSGSESTSHPDGWSQPQPTPPPTLVEESNNVIFRSTEEDLLSAQETSQDSDIALQPVERISLAKTRVSLEGTPERQAGELAEKYNPACRASCQDLWNSKWLLRPSLFCFALLFAALILAVTLLYYFAGRNNGLSTEISRNHYLWTYGPTAVLVILLSFWKQVDFACKILSPWKRLAGGTCKANEVLLLDYVSPIMPTVMWSAARNHDWHVLTTCIGELLFRLVIIFSTGLLVLTPTVTTLADTEFVVDTEFSSSVSDSASTALGGSAAMAYYGIWKEGLVYPYGVTDEFAYETVIPASQLANSTIIATVNGFYPDITCHETRMNATLSFEKTYSSNNSVLLQYTGYPPGCPPFSDLIYACSPIDDACQSEEILFDVEQGQSLYPISVDYEAQCEQMWVWYIAKVQYERNSAEPADTRSGWNVNYSNLTALTCYANYSIAPLDIYIDLTNYSQINEIKFSARLPERSTQLPGYSPATFDADTFVQLGDDALFSMNRTSLLLLRDPNLTVIDLLDPNVFSQAIVQAFKGFAAQVVHQTLRKTAARHVMGKTQYMTQRLQIRPLSLWVMIGGFIALLLSTIFAILLRPRKVVSRNPNSIASFAALLNASPQMDVLLGRTRNLPAKELEAAFTNVDLVTKISPDPRSQFYSIHVSLQDNAPSAIEKPAAVSTKLWWQPLQFSIFFMLWTTLAPISIIIVLEVLQHVSDSGYGILDVGDSSMVARSAAPILSSFIMILVATAYDSLEFAVLSFGPYLTLQTPSTISQSSLLSNFVGHLPFWTIWKCVQKRSPPAAMSAIAATLGSFLTIIASGLYTIEIIQHPQQVSVSGFDHFGSDWHNTTSVSGAIIALDLLEHENATYPAYTFDEMVFPRFSPDTVKLLQASNSTTLQISIPARRGSLNCTSVPRENITVSFAETDPSIYETTWGTSYSFVAEVPSSCSEYKNLSNFRQSAITFKVSGGYDNGTNPPATSFKLASLLTRGNFWLANSTVPLTDWSGTGSPSNPPECPSLGFVFGIINEYSKSTDNITAFLCSQGFEDLEANVTFLTSDMTISPRRPPLIDETSARWTTSSGGTGNFLDQTVKWAAWNASGVVSTSQLDTFFQTLAYGPEGIPFEELLGPKNEEKLFEAVQHLYRKWMAQAINANMRVPVREDVPTYQGILPDSGKPRLVQHRPSKMALQVLLGIMLVCNLMIYPSTRKLRRLLPHCPWSMLGVMTLMAQSDLCTKGVLPQGAEFMSDARLDQELRGWLFSLGWWENDTTRRYGIDVGRAGQAAGDEEPQTDAQNINGAASRKTKGPYTAVTATEDAANLLSSEVTETSSHDTTPTRFPSLRLPSDQHGGDILRRQ